ncbi:MAG: DUF4270 family protein [Flavobacteriaceae bacterium]|nr:DUF4270 family protein [Flavobacteriaceae bacterium]
MTKKILQIALVLAVVSCDKKFNEVGQSILPTDLYKAKSVSYPVTISHASIDVVQTNNASVLQLGEREDKLFGNTSAAIVSQLNLTSYSPTFGTLTSVQENESNFNELETVSNAWLEIPFFTSQTDSDGDGLIDEFDVDDNDVNSDSDGDGVSDITERNNGTNPMIPDTDGDGILDDVDETNNLTTPLPKLYAIDSLFGDREATFNVSVSKLNYFLRQLDPEKNFEQSQAYYSDFQINSYKEETLFNQAIQLDFDEVAIVTDTIKIAPRMRIALDPDFFQQTLINKEGSSELSSIENWQDYFRSIAIETSNFSTPLLMLLDVTNMLVRVEYDYQTKETNDAGAEVIVTKNNQFLLNAAAAIKFNTLLQSTPPDAILNDIVSTSQQEHIALSGGLGSVAILNLFEDNEVLEALKGQPWLLNEANLTLYVNQQETDFYNSSLPQRLYLSNADNAAPIIDFTQDASATSTLSRLVYGGYLVEEEEKQYYKIRITDHLRNIISNDSTNVPLQLSLSNVFSSQTAVQLANVKDPEGDKIPVGTVVSPKSAVFVGPNPSDPDLADLKLQLELFYTEID